MTATKTNKGKVAGGASAIALIIAAVFAVEGGYVNNPKDPGGATNHGVTEAVARKHDYRGHMKDLPKYTMIIYLTGYDIDFIGGEFEFVNQIIKPKKYDFHNA